MSNKKSLLTESEVRRFMALANIPAIGGEVVNERMGMNQTPESPQREYMSSPQEEGYGSMEEMGSMYEEDPMGDEEMPPEAGGEEMGTGGAMSAEDLAEKIVDILVSAGLVEKDGGEAEMDAGGGEEMSDLEMGDDEEGSGEESEEESGEEEEEEELEEAKKEEELEEAKKEEELQESKLVDTILARVTARLIAEAKKSKMSASDKKKKEEAAKKKKEMMKKKAAAAKKKLEEANAPAPKATMSNASAAGVAKAAGKSDKGTFGVTSAMRKDDSFEKGTSKRGDKMTDVSPSAEHIVSHGKKNLATQGGNKKK